MTEYLLDPNVWISRGGGNESRQFYLVIWEIATFTLQSNCLVRAGMIDGVCHLINNTAHP
jgi:hypothetical protein